MKTALAYRFASLSLLLLAGLFCGTVASVLAQSAAVDPQSLVGEWSGDFTPPGGVISGKYYLTIEKVDGNKVSGKGELHGKRVTPFKVQGTVDGNKLSYGTTTLAVDGDKMEGVNSNNGYQISVRKQK